MKKEKELLQSEKILSYTCHTSFGFDFAFLTVSRQNKKRKAGSFIKNSSL